MDSANVTSASGRSTRASSCRLAQTALVAVGVVFAWTQSRAGPYVPPCHRPITGSATIWGAGCECGRIAWGKPQRRKDAGSGTQRDAS